MLPSDRSSLASPANRASLLAGAALAALGAIGLGTPAAAQDATQDPPTADQPDGVDEAVQDYIEGEAPPPGTEREIGFEADTLEYDSDADTIVARGNVVLREGERSVRADQVRWDRPAGQIQASGNVRYVDGDGNQLYAEQLEQPHRIFVARTAPIGGNAPARAQFVPIE